MSLFDVILRILLGFLLAAAISAMMRDRDHAKALSELRIEVERLKCEQAFDKLEQNGTNDHEEQIAELDANE